MSRRNKIIIATLALLLLILLIVLWWLWSKKQNVESIDQFTGSAIEVPAVLPNSSAGLPDQAAILPAVQNLEADIKAIAMTFAERFGSYSNEGNFSNLTEAKDLMSARMQEWAKNLTTSQENNSPESYYGVTTIAVSASIDSLDQSLGTAAVTVTTQRRESKVSTVNPRVFYQKLILKLVNNGAGWKVDEATWQ